MATDKRARHQEILRLLKRKQISSQEELRLELESSGFRVTQATLSRDLRELGVARVVNAEGAYIYEVPGDGVRPPLRSLESSGNLIVIKTDPGLAPVIAYRIDALDSDRILGTVAGEDTVLVVVAEGQSTTRAKEELWKLLGE